MIFKIYIIIFVLLLLFSCNNSENISPQEKVAISEINKKYKDDLMKMNKNIFELNNEIINKTIERRKWKMQESETGLYWEILKTTDGEQLKSGQTVEFSYKIFLLKENKLVYSSEESGNRTLTIGKNQEESGINEGLKKMRYGEKARFIIPPHLAFGVTGDGYKIGSYEILIYEIEIVSITN